MKNKKIVICAAVLLAGLALVALGGFVITAEEYKKISGICIGVGAGVFGVSVAQIITIIIMLKNPDVKHRATIEEKDERNVLIREKAKAKGFDAMGVIFGITMLIFVLINADLMSILLIVAAYLIVYAVQIYYLSKYSKEL